MTPPGRFSRNHAAQAAPGQVSAIFRVRTATGLCRCRQPVPASAPPPSPATGSPPLSHHRTVTRRPGPADGGSWPPVRPDGAAVRSPAQGPRRAIGLQFVQCIHSRRSGRQPECGSLTIRITQIGMISAATGARSCRIAGVDCTDTYASTGILIHGAVGSTYISGISARRCYGFLDDPGPAEYALRGAGSVRVAAISASSN